MQFPWQPSDPCSSGFACDPLIASPAADNNGACRTGPQKTKPGAGETCERTCDKMGLTHIDRLVSDAFRLRCPAHHIWVEQLVLADFTRTQTRRRVVKSVSSHQQAAARGRTAARPSDGWRVARPERLCFSYCDDAFIRADSVNTRNAYRCRNETFVSEVVRGWERWVWELRWPTFPLQRTQIHWEPAVFSLHLLFFFKSRPQGQKQLVWCAAGLPALTLVTRVAFRCRYKLSYCVLGTNTG